MKPSTHCTQDSRYPGLRGSYWAQHSDSAQLTLLVLDFGFDILNGVTGLDLKGDGLARQGLHKDLHLCACLGDRVSMDGGSGDH